jgi:hypothetical protein
VPVPAYDVSTSRAPVEVAKGGGGMARGSEGVVGALESLNGAGAR